MYVSRRWEKSKASSLLAVMYVEKEGPHAEWVALSVYV
jgi:hypothetical protein